jgi:hypothetical protein
MLSSPLITYLFASSSRDSELILSMLYLSAAYLLRALAMVCHLDTMTTVAGTLEQ